MREHIPRRQFSPPYSNTAYYSWRSSSAFSETYSLNCPHQAHQAPAGDLDWIIKALPTLLKKKEIYRGTTYVSIQCPALVCPAPSMGITSNNEPRSKSLFLLMGYLNLCWTQPCFLRLPWIRVGTRSIPDETNPGPQRWLYQHDNKKPTEQFGGSNKCESAAGIGSLENVHQVDPGLHDGL